MIAPPANSGAVLHLVPDRADLARLYPWLDEAVAGAPIGETLLARMHVAVEEAVVNVALHGRPSFITVNLAIEPHATRIDIEDDGIPFDPTTPAPPAAPASDETAVGGWGLGLIRRFCPEISYVRDNAHNRLSLRFPLAADGSTSRRTHER